MCVTDQHFFNLINYIIKQIPDMNKFLKSNLSCSFLAHMPVYKMKSDTTKCRVVYLSNLADKTGFSQITTFRPRPPLEVAIYIYIKDAYCGHLSLIGTGPQKQILTFYRTIKFYCLAVTSYCDVSSVAFLTKNRLCTT